MAETAYTYDMPADFPGGEMNSDNLVNEIQGSSITIALEDVRINPDGSDIDRVDIVFKDALPAADKTTLDGDTVGPAGGLIAAHNSTPVEIPQEVILSGVSVDVDSRIEVATQASSGLEAMFVSSDFCDPTTWFMDYMAVIDEEVKSTWNAGEKSVTVSGDGTGDPINVIIDMYHGMIYDEENWTDPTSDSYDPATDGYKITVKVDSAEKTERPPFATDWSEGGDFYVDYTNRKIIFQLDQAGATIIEVSYCYPKSSRWKMVPISGKKLNIEKAVVQFSSNIDIDDTIIFWTKVKTDPAPVYIDAVRPTKYKNYCQIIQEGLGVFPTILAGGGIRGIPVDFWNIPFHYTRRREIRSMVSLGMEVWISLENDKPFGGHHSSVTFYCSVSDDTASSLPEPPVDLLPQTNLVAEWRHLDGAGQILSDSVGAFDGQLGTDAGVDSADPAWVTGGLGYDGGDLVELGTAGPLDGAAQWSMLVALKLPVAASTDREIFAKADYSGFPTSSIELRTFNGNVDVFYYNAVSASVSYSYTGQPIIILLLVYDNSTLKIYQGTTLKDTSIPLVGKPFPDHATAERFGNRSSGIGAGHNEGMYYGAKWRKALDSSEISTAFTVVKEALEARGLVVTS